MIRYAWFPDARRAPEWGERVVEIFRRHETEIGSQQREDALSGEQGLQGLGADLREAGFVIEKRKLAARHAPAALLGNGSPFVRDQFDVFHPQWLCCLAIEGGGRMAAEPGTWVEPLAVVDVDTLCVALPNAGRE